MMTNKKLTHLEDVIATARRWAFEAAKALREIRDRRLYREQYATFEAYVAERWGMDRTYAYRNCSWAETMQQLLPIGNRPLPECESHARPLYGLRPEDQRTIWRAVLSHKSRVTAELVTETVREHLDRIRSKKATAEVAAATAGYIVNTDASSGLRMLDDGSVDLMLFSPPYESTSATYPTISDERLSAWMLELFTVAKPKLSARGSIMFIAREPAPGGEIGTSILDTRLTLRRAGWREIDVLVWVKPDTISTGRADRPRRSYESVYWFSATANPYVDLHSSSRILQNITPKLRANGDWAQTYGASARVSDIIIAPIGGTDRDHPTPFPVSLCRQLIETYSPVGGLVVDPCCGTGSALVAARDVGRRWWGCDVVTDYVDIARKRLGLGAEKSPLRGTFSNQKQSRAKKRNRAARKGVNHHPVSSHSRNSRSSSPKKAARRPRV